jgi:hypothetical protein
MLAKHSNIPGRAGVALLAIEPGDEARIEVLSASMRKLVDHPGLIHVPILAPPSRESHGLKA